MRFLMILGLAVAAGCGPTITYDYTKEPDPRRKEYVIGVSDGLRISVWKNPELSGDTHVRPDGTITLPLVGDLQAAGLTPTQLKDAIREKLRAFVKDEAAVVTVAVTDPTSYRFTVSGNVEHPGVFSSRYYVTVLDAVALAGGLNRFAAPHQLTLVRVAPNGQILRRVPLDYERVSSGLHPEENLVLLSGDTLIVP
jgi:polysaccharide export outer membrane protein